MKRGKYFVCVEELNKFFTKIEKISPIINRIGAEGGIAYLVGGSVRDLVFGIRSKDIDIEVHKISLQTLEECLRKFGQVSLIGKQFGVLKLHSHKKTKWLLDDFSLFDVDWSLPRKDSKGRKPMVVVDPTLTITEASRRRDVTMNAMAIDLSFVCDTVTALREQVKEIDSLEAFASVFHIIDPFGGIADIKNKKLRLVDKNLFKEDPLRFYRVMQFVGRFEMTPDEELSEVCKKINLRDVAKGGELARERIYEEIKKLLLQSRRPSLGFRWVKNIDRLNELFPEIGALVGVAQRADYHPEGDVFEHTMQCLDASAKLPMTDESGVSEEEKFMIMLAVLAHDFGKATHTDADLHTKDHDKAGVPLAKLFLRRFTWNVKLIRSVCKLVRYHMMPLQLVEQKSSLKAYKKLAIKLAPEVSLEHLYWVMWADVRGRNAVSREPLEKGFGGDDALIEMFLKNIREAKIEKGPEKPVLQGRDLLGVIEPGPEMGKLLKKAYLLQIDEGITNKDELKKRVLQTNRGAK